MRVEGPQEVPSRTDEAAWRGVVVTAAGPNMRRVLHECSLPTFRRFADRWGYDVRAVDLELDGAAADESAQRAKWAKVPLLREALAEFPIALWLDADVLVMRTDEDVAVHLHPDHFQALVLEHVPDEHRVNPNTGVWLMRSCRQAFDFLDAVEGAGQQPGPWADQGAVLDALGWCRGDDAYHWARPGPGLTVPGRDELAPTRVEPAPRRRPDDGELLQLLPGVLATRPPFGIRMRCTSWG